MNETISPSMPLDPQQLRGSSLGYDAVLLMSFGGPETHDEVMPFLRRVTAGRGIPDERLAEVAEHYWARDGYSPINDQCRALRTAIAEELSRRQVDVEVLWGNRNSAPFVDDVLADAYDRGIRKVVMVTTSAYPSYSSCRQYREDLARALPAEDFVVDKIGPYALTPGFVEANCAAVQRALAEVASKLPTPQPAQPDLQPDHRPPHVLFVTHSIPTQMAEAAGPSPRPVDGAYVAWHRRVMEAVLAACPQLTGELVYCSRSGSPHQPWLEPDVNDRLRELVGEVAGVVLAPIGFVSDHMEVIHDLDTEALATAAEVGLACVRADTAGLAPEFVSQLVDLVMARAAVSQTEPHAGAATHGPAWTRCAVDCCENLRNPTVPVIA